MTTVTHISSENKRKYNRTYEAKFTPEQKERRRAAQAACKRKLRAARKIQAHSQNIDSAPPPNDPPTPELPPSGHHFQLDALQMRGTQVPEDAELITWSDGNVTILPTVMREGRNVLADDAELTKKLAEVPTSKPGSQFVAHFNFKDTSRDDLITGIRASLGEGKCVVIRGIAKPGPPELSVEYLEKRYRIQSTMRVDMHDMELRAKEPSKPHVTGTVGDLIAGIFNPNEQRCILDCLIHTGLPEELSVLDDGLMAWHRSIRDCPLEGKFVHPDNFLVNGWGLIHQGGVVTTPHHDSEGQNTFVIGDIGLKFWVWFFYKGPKDRQALLHASTSLCDEYDFSQFATESITVHPGDLIIQPPGQLHSVYTPIPSFTRGGHFYAYDTLSFTELSRWLDRQAGLLLTNQVHEHTEETLWRMTAIIPRLPPSEVPHRKPLLALCHMVLSAAQYVAQGTRSTILKRNAPKVIQSSSKDRANAIVQKILHHMNIAAMDLPEILQNTASEDPDAIIDLGNCLSEFQSM
ncbi:uncharacterized protein F5147DRAFT_777801 [Suillus discolor]|uniref:JmjC domain-containing protein n=1 Tax=Suillus discolor TaxID=1912936 RepID=A0A9P7EZK3_9AGAM|nr:uncharacterized protein F5147DRAFT_777801 [Suillus discolor]KAG2097933.1 hypothetical protein F5147DRAFT_777801 [Suillus discolor]